MIHQRNVSANQIKKNNKPTGRCLGNFTKKSQLFYFIQVGIVALGKTDTRIAHIARVSVGLHCTV